MSTVAKTEFEKSIARLESLTKSQLFHTPSDSEPGTWAGSAPSDEDSMDDMIQENGTDYDGVKKALAAKVAIPAKLTKAEVAIIKGQNPFGFIREKIAKGKALTSAERWVAKGLGRQVFSQFLKKGDGMDNSPKKDGVGEENKTARDVPSLNVADKNDGKEEPEAASKSHGRGKGDLQEWAKEEEDEDAHKSLAHFAARQPDLSKGIEMSPVLHQFAVAMGQALEGQKDSVVKSVTRALTPIFVRIDALEKSLNDFAGGQLEFNKSMGEAVVGIGQQIAGAGEVANANAGLPAGAPRSQLRAIQGGQNGVPGVNAIQKSFNGPGGLESGEGAMAKSQIVNVMADMVKSGKLQPLEVVKYESTGELSPHIQQAVLAFAQGGGR